MLFANGCDYAGMGMHKVAYLLDVAGLFGPHLHNEHLVVRLQMFPDGTDNAECGVEAAGCHDCGEVLLQDTVEVMFG